MNAAEKDWRLFRSKLPEWQERYMERIVNEYKQILDSDALASEKFWAIVAYLTDHISEKSADIAELLGVKSTRVKQLLKESKPDHMDSRFEK